MTKDKPFDRKCMYCKYFGETQNKKYVCGRFNKKHQIINNPKMESCNYFVRKE